MRVVFDTNIYVSFLISSSGTITELLNFWQQGKFEVFISSEILAELGQVLLGPKLKSYLCLTRQEIKQYLKLVAQTSLVAKVDCRVNLIKEDPADNKFLELAKTIGADFIVTGDRHLLRLEQFGETKIISAKELVEKIDKSR